MKRLFALFALLGSVLLMPSKSAAQFITHYSTYTTESCTAPTSPPDMVITKQRYDTFIDPVVWGWEDFGIMWRFGTSGSWSHVLGNLTQYGFADISSQLVANCSHHP